MTGPKHWRARVKALSATVGAGIFLLASCATQQFSIDPAGPQADKIATLWWFFLATLTTILSSSWRSRYGRCSRRHRGIEQEPLETTHLPSPSTERKLTRVVTGATIVTVVILFVLLVCSIGTSKAVSELGDTERTAWRSR